MHTFSKLLALLLILMVHFSPAQETAVKSASKVEEEKSLASFMGESHANRFNKQALITLNIGAILSLPANGLRSGYFIDDRNLVGIGYFKYSEATGTDYDEEDAETVNVYTDEEPLFSGNVVQFYFQHYVSNSFYFRPSLNYRNQTTIDERRNTYDNFTDKVIESDEKGKANYQDLVLGMTIGNQWQWENFTIGCDWIGFGSPIATLGYQGDQSGFAGNSTLTLLHLYAGASF